MMRLFFLHLILTFMVSCDTMQTYISGHKISCIHGVAYVQFPAGASVMYEQNGEILNCSDPIIAGSKKKNRLWFDNWSRWGRNIKGPRDIALVQCEACKKKKLDIKTLEADRSISRKNPMKKPERTVMLWKTQWTHAVNVNVIMRSLLMWFVSIALKVVSINFPFHRQSLNHNRNHQPNLLQLKFNYQAIRCNRFAIWFGQLFLKTISTPIFQ